MAINPETAFPGKIAPSSTEFPYGEARDVTVPGDGKGTPWKALLLNDIFGFQQALLKEAVIVPSGTPDEVGASQYLNSLIKLFDHVVPSTQSMLAADLGKYSEIATLGYAASADGGGARFNFTGNTVGGSAGTEDWTLGLVYDVNGREFKIVHDGSLRLSQAGLVGDWDGATGTDNSTRFAEVMQFAEVTTVYGAGATARYYFGTLTGNTILVSLSRQVRLDWRGAEIVIDGDNGGAFTSTSFVQFLDSPGSMVNYVFDDRNFLFAGPSRGVKPVAIDNAAADTAGYEIGPCHIKRGQSLFTAFSSDPNNFRASDIRLVGPCHGDDVYYGINLANNGDNCSGEYSLDRVNRGIFVYGVKDCTASFYAREGQASSSNLLISNSGVGFPRTENIKVRGHFGTLDGPLDIVDQPQVADPADGRYRNIDVTFIVDANGGNIALTDPFINIGAFATISGFVPSGTLEMDNIRVDFRTPLAVTNPVIVQTQSPNFGTLELAVGSKYNYYGLASDFKLIEGYKLTKVATGDLTATTVSVPAEILTGTPANGFLSCKATINAIDGFTGARNSLADYWLQGTTDSGGLLTLIAATLIDQRDVGGVNPVYTFGVSGANLTLDTTLYNDANGILKLHLERL